MSNLAFRMLRMGHPNPIAEFNWPVGKEMASDLRRLTVNEFHLALQLAAKCVREMKETSDYKEKYESLLSSFQRYVQKQSSDNLQEQIACVTEEIALIKGLLDAPVAEPEPVKAVTIQKKRGRPKKVT
jgi:hypothetical protein